jgi:hypothetical protein
VLGDNVEDAAGQVQGRRGIEVAALRGASEKAREKRGKWEMRGAPGQVGEVGSGIDRSVSINRPVFKMNNI